MNLTHQELLRWLQRHKACEGAMEWVQARGLDAQETWECCVEPDRMMWALGRLAVPQRHIEKGLGTMLHQTHKYLGWWTVPREARFALDALLRGKFRGRVRGRALLVLTTSPDYRRYWNDPRRFTDRLRHYLLRAHVNALDYAQQTSRMPSLAVLAVHEICNLFGEYEKRQNPPLDAGLYVADLIREAFPWNAIAPYLHQESQDGIEQND